MKTPSTETLALIGVGGVIGVALLLRAGKANAMSGGSVSVSSSELSLYRSAIPSAGGQYAHLFIESAQRHGVSAFVLAAICKLESQYGAALRPVGPEGTNADGSDRGLMQINRRAHPAFMDLVDYETGKPRWMIPRYNIDYGAAVLEEYTNYFRRASSGAGDPRPLTGRPLLLAGLASYNAGPGNVLTALKAGRDPDTVTALGFYGKRVAGDADTFEATFRRLSTPMV